MVQRTRERLLQGARGMGSELRQITLRLCINRVLSYGVLPSRVSFHLLASPLGSRYETGSVVSNLPNIVKATGRNINVVIVVTGTIRVNV